MRKKLCFVNHFIGDDSTQVTGGLFVCLFVCLFIRFEPASLCLRAVVLQDLFREHVCSLDRKVHPELFCSLGHSDRRLWHFWREFEKQRVGSGPLRDRKMDERTVLVLKVSLPLTVFCVEVDFLCFITVMFSDHHEACKSQG